MIQKRIKHILNNPLEVKPTDLLQLQEERKRFPYFYPLILLQTKAIYNHNDNKDSLALQEASVYASNRKILYDYLNFKAKEDSAKKLNTDIDTEYTHTESLDDTVKVESESSSSNVESESITTPLEIKEDIISTDIKEKEEPSIKENLRITEETEEKTVKETAKVETSKLENQTLGKRELFIQANHSFTDWLKINAKPVDKNLETTDKSEEDNNQKEEIEEKFKTIEAFLDKNPKIIPAKEYKPTLDINVNQKPNLSHLMTETLANIYVEQNKYDKAIKAYRILRLKYPEKSGYFADRIKEINELKNK
ncbi:MAG: hypothetical protein ACR2MS_10800 [Weeksellaceae bacterium]